MSWECAIDGDPCDLLVERSIKAARKQHKCAFCENPITIGSPYRKWFWIFDGVLGEEKYHAECKALMHDASEMICGEPVIAFGTTLADASGELLSESARGSLGVDPDHIRDWMVANGDIMEKYGYGE